MAKIQYREIKFRADSLALIELASEIIEDYDEMGYDLTLRQLYYQLVARGHIENTERSYKRIGSLINDARLAGLIDWSAITDRTRNMVQNSHWSSPMQIINGAISQYAIDKRADQPWYLEVWVEKEALIGVVGKVCEELDVPYFACRGYVSQSEMWAAARRLDNALDTHESCKIIYLGDHDPSGVDMPRDIRDRLYMFEAPSMVDRIALTMEQIEQYAPPPNPAKLTDSRCKDYIERYGDESWELDALSPQVIADLITDAVNDCTDFDLLKAKRSKEATEKASMKKYSTMFD